MTDRYAETDTWPNPPASQQPARPATLAASEASRVLGEGSDAQEAREALSEVEHLRRAHWEMTQEAARLRAEVDQLRWQWHQECDNFERECNRADAAEAEVERLTQVVDRRKAHAEQAESERDAALVALASQDTYTEEGGLIIVAQLREQRARAESAERARDAALAEVTELRDRLGRVEALCLCKADGCPCGGDRVVVPTRDLRAALAPPVTGDTEDASPAAKDSATSAPRVRLTCPSCGGRPGFHRTWCTAAASPTAPATEGGAK